MAVWNGSVCVIQREDRRVGVRCKSMGENGSETYYHVGEMRTDPLLTSAEGRLIVFVSPRKILIKESADKDADWEVMTITFSKRSERYEIPYRFAKRKANLSQPAICCKDSKLYLHGGKDVLDDIGSPSPILHVIDLETGCWDVIEASGLSPLLYGHQMIPTSEGFLITSGNQANTDRPNLTVSMLNLSKRPSWKRLTSLQFHPTHSTVIDVSASCRQVVCIAGKSVYRSELSPSGIFSTWESHILTQKITALVGPFAVFDSHDIRMYVSENFAWDEIAVIRTPSPPPPSRIMALKDKVSVSSTKDSPIQMQRSPGLSDRSSEPATPKSCLKSLLSPVTKKKATFPMLPDMVLPGPEPTREVPQASPQTSPVAPTPRNSSEQHLFRYESLKNSRMLPYQHLTLQEHAAMLLLSPRSEGGDDPLTIPDPLPDPFRGDFSLRKIDRKSPWQGALARNRRASKTTVTSRDT